MGNDARKRPGKRATAILELYVGIRTYLQCTAPYSVVYLQVIWMKGRVPLTLEDQLVYDDVRFSVTRPYTRQWNLRIETVQHRDQGVYACTINTDPVQNKTVTLHVRGTEILQQ